MFGSQRCDCGPQLGEADERIAESGGYLLILRQEGRGIGLYAKLDANALQDAGFDTYEANLALGHREDERSYLVAAQMLRALGVSRVALLGEFKWSSQRSMKEGCGGQAKGMGVGADGAAGDAFAGSSAGGAAGASAAVLGVARGVTSEDAAVGAGVSPAVGVRWFREGGGMPSVTMGPLSGRYLSFSEREEIALVRAPGEGVREIARQLGRAPVDDLAGVASQRRDTNGPVDVSREHRAVARGPAVATPETGEAGRQRRAAAVRAGPSERRGVPPRRRCGDRS